MEPVMALISQTTQTAHVLWRGDAHATKKAHLSSSSSAAKTAHSPYFLAFPSGFEKLVCLSSQPLNVSDLFWNIPGCPAGRVPEKHGAPRLDNHATTFCRRPDSQSSMIPTYRPHTAFDTGHNREARCTEVFVHEIELTRQPWKNGKYEH
jgi:hypothetical protein